MISIGTSEYSNTKTPCSPHSGTKSAFGASLYPGTDASRSRVSSRGSEPDQDLQLGGAAGRLLALEGDGWLVGSLQTLLHLSQHAPVDGRPLVGRGDVMHAV